jgi:hypothetical protein
MGGDSVRGGVRGGRDQFNWEEVKTDKFRECYLGASVKASVGRWQKNRDVLWYTRDGGPGGAQAAADELAAVKGEEERLMQEALGLRPVTQRRGASTLDNGELQHMLKRGAGVDGTEEGGGGGTGDDLRVKGVGYTPAVAEHQKSAAQQVKAGEVFDGREVLAGVAQAPLLEREHHGGQGHAGLRAAHHADSDSGERRRRRKEAKHARKEARREAKEARREHRRRSHSPAERRHRSRSRSRSRSASRDRDRDRRRH